VGIRGFHLGLEVLVIGFWYSFVLSRNRSGFARSKLEVRKSKRQNQNQKPNQLQKNLKFFVIKIAFRLSL
jgi:hypothetical protein